MKKILCVFSVCLFLVLSLRPCAISAEEITLASVNWRPYAADDLHNNGFTSEIIRSAFERVGYQASFKFFPWKRAMLLVQRGMHDALYSAYYSEERAQTYAVSEPYATSEKVFCARKDMDIEYTELRDLTPYRIGIVNGYVNTPEFDRADYLKKDPVSSDTLNLKKLLRGRVDLIVIDKFVALDILKNNPMIEGGPGDVKFLDPPLSLEPLYVMFSKALPGYEKKVADFNEGLRQITEDGTLDEILTQTGFAPEQ